jgi:prophage regulatory protein
MHRTATRPTAPGRRLIRLPEVRSRTGLSKTTIWRHTRRGEFPKPVTLTRGTIGWVEEEVDDWIDARIEARFGALNAPDVE